MLVNLAHVLEIAEEKNCAVGAFNCPNLENAMAVLQVAEKYNVPVILMHAELHEQVVPLSVIGPVLITLAKEAKVPVCVHLDHCEHLSYLYECLALGFTSVMFDGSLLPYDENVEKTKQAVAKAKQYGANVEAELGILGGREAGSQPTTFKQEDLYTDPELAVKFVEATGIDALAASFGTAHGFYTVKPKLDFERIEKIKKNIDIPLVMHGGSGVSEEDYLTAISKGIRKINYYSYMGKAGVEAVRQYLDQQDVAFYHELAQVATEKMAENVEQAMRIFWKQ